MELEHLQKLKTLVEESAMHPLKTTKDFEALHWQMQERVRDTLSISTLKRMWGYVDGYDTTREDTLDLLCRFVGYPDWHTFVSDYCNVESEQTSHRIVSSTLSADELKVSEYVAIEWNPNRRLVLSHKGKGVFEVMYAQNSKITQGDTLHCDRFILNQPLYIDNLVHNGMPSVMFVVGKKGGITKVERVRE
jgi:hypothetical protein